MVDPVLKQIIAIATHSEVDSVLLFGSRARGDHRVNSDYDIAVFGSLSASKEARFAAAVDDIETLKKVDLVFVNERVSEELVRNIKEEGKLLYARPHQKVNELPECLRSTEGSSPPLPKGSLQ